MDSNKLRIHELVLVGACLSLVIFDSCLRVLFTLIFSSFLFPLSILFVIWIFLSFESLVSTARSYNMVPFNFPNHTSKSGQWCSARLL